MSSLPFCDDNADDAGFYGRRLSTVLCSIAFCRQFSDQLLLEGKKKKIWGMLRTFQESEGESLVGHSVDTTQVSLSSSPLQTKCGHTHHTLHKRDCPQSRGCCSALSPLYYLHSGYARHHFSSPLDRTVRSSFGLLATARSLLFAPLGTFTSEGGSSCMCGSGISLHQFCIPRMPVSH